MSLKTYPYDPTESLDTPEAARKLISATFESGDAGYIAYAIGIFMRSKGMTEIAKQTNLSRRTAKSFYRQQCPNQAVLLVLTRGKQRPIRPTFYARDSNPAAASR